MNERLDERLRTAAQTYRRLGNHSAESMLLDAADIIWQLRDDLQRANAENAKLRDELENARMRGDDLASSISEWRAVTEARGQTIDRLAADNAKLRELVSGLEYCVQGYVCDSCPLYDPSGTNHRRCESLERDIGVEVD